MSALYVRTRAAPHQRFISARFCLAVSMILRRLNTSCQRLPPHWRHSTAERIAASCRVRTLLATSGFERWPCAPVTTLRGVSVLWVSVFLFVCLAWLFSCVLLLCALWL